MESEDGIYEAKGGRDTTPLWCGTYQAKEDVAVRGLLQQCIRETKTKIVYYQLIIYYFRGYKQAQIRTIV